MSKRLGLYVRGLQHAGVDASIVTTHRPAGSALSAYTNPFILPFQVKKEHDAVLKASDVILVDGFNWFTYFWLGAWYGGGKTKLLYELNEKPGTVYTSRLLELKPIKALGLMLTRWAMRSFDGFVVISEPLREFISAQKRPDARIVKLPIIIDTREPFTEVTSEIPPHPYIIHTGALSQQKDGIIDVFKAFAEVNARFNRKLHFYLAGSKDAPPGVWDEINKVIDDNQLKDNVHFLGMLFGDKLKTLQKNCLFLVLPKPDNEQNRNNFPTKLGEYLAFSRPVITSKVGDMGLFMRDGETALIVEPGNVAQIRDAMWKLLGDPALAEKLGAAGRQVAEQEFDYTILGTRLAEFCNTLKR
jgi:glycosyltransferase involved in cell wall biosynthesis